MTHEEQQTRGEKQFLTNHSPKRTTRKKDDEHNVSRLKYVLLFCSTNVFDSLCEPFDDSLQKETLTDFQHVQVLLQFPGKNQVHYREKLVPFRCKTKDGKKFSWQFCLFYFYLHYYTIVMQVMKLLCYSLLPTNRCCRCVVLSVRNERHVSTFNHFKLKKTLVKNHQSLACSPFLWVYFVMMRYPFLHLIIPITFFMWPTTLALECLRERLCVCVVLVVLFLELSWWDSLYPTCIADLYYFFKYSRFPKEMMMNTSKDLHCCFSRIQSSHSSINCQTTGLKEIDEKVMMLMLWEIQFSILTLVWLSRHSLTDRLLNKGCLILFRFWISHNQSQSWYQKCKPGIKGHWVFHLERHQVLTTTSKSIARLTLHEESLMYKQDNWF